MFRSAACLLVQTLGWSLRWIQINRVTLDSERSQGNLNKRRKWYSWLPIFVGNLVFRFRYPSLRVLHTKQWLAWEQRVHSAMQQSDSKIFHGRQLNTKILPGQPLASLLIQADQTRFQEFDEPLADRSVENSETEMLRWVGWATRALADLHAVGIEVPFCGGRQSGAKASLSQGSSSTKDPSRVKLSHADAGVTNVMINVAEQTASWFDFDLRHDLNTAAIERQADDLRAFLFTLILCYRWRDMQKIVQTVRREYNSPDVWRALKRQIGDRSFDLDFFHTAQLARCGGHHWDRLKELRQIIVNEI